MKKSGLKIITFKIDENTIAELEKYSFAMGLSRSEIIRRAILFYLKHNKPQSDHPRVKIVEVV
jgi:metal-responsive CopG/Arc/MetJ family transcriptional regulator